MTPSPKPKKTPAKKRAVPAAKRLEQAIVSSLEDIKARDIEIFDVRHLTTMFDKVIIATAESTRQTKALANHLRETVKELGSRVHSVEGEDSGEWVLVDLGDTIVHIMQPAVRENYALEELWDHPKPKVSRKRPPASGDSGDSAD